MNIVYLIGNGFDMNLGMKTSYYDFYKHYLKLPSNEDSDVVKSFKRKLSTDLNNRDKNWSDLELALGGYLKDLGTEQAEELHQHLVEKLSDYIKHEEEKWPFDVNQKGLFDEHLMYPWLKNPYPTEIAAINKFLHQRQTQTWNIQIITFNYSRSIERIFSKQLPVLITRRDNRYETILSAIDHIHGFTDQGMILGVNDATQIKNEMLRGESRVTNRYVKSDCNNNVYRTEHDAKCLQWIYQANLICTFGVSFGDTDKKWWKAVGDALQNDCKMILFAYGNKLFTGNQGVAKLEEESRIKSEFVQKTGIEDSQRETVMSNIYVAYNTDMFKLDIGKRVVPKSE
jgi:hypothetical protein